MNITARPTTFGTWDRRRFQHILAACVAGLAISVAVAVGATELSSTGGSGSRSALEPVVAAQPLPTYFYLVDSPEKVELLNIAQGELAGAAQNGYVPDRYIEVIDVSTAEGQALLDSINQELFEASSIPGFQANVTFINWMD
jgi:hypothetical protein